VLNIGWRGLCAVCVCVCVANLWGLAAWPAEAEVAARHQQHCLVGLHAYHAQPLFPLSLTRKKGHNNMERAPQQRVSTEQVSSGKQNPAQIKEKKLIIKTHLMGGAHMKPVSYLLFLLGGYSRKRLFDLSLHLCNTDERPNG
jgi:hypothetical protein